MAGSTCDVCGRGNVIGVACSGLGAISFAYCAECAAIGAEPLGMLKGTIEMCGGPEEVHPSILTIPTWKDGRYMSYPDYMKE